MYRCGYVGVFGRPNAGKSTLVNRLVGQQVAIVSAKPQTTRDNIIGILNEDNVQMILVDTPGIHYSKNQLDRAMMKNVRSALAGVDAILYLFDGSKAIDEEEKEYIEHIKSLEIPVIIAKTKSDKKSANNEYFDFNISAKTGEGINELKNALINLLPQSKVKNFVFDEDYFTDKSVRFLIAEKIRECALNNLQFEVPHGVAVVIESFKEEENLVSIDALIICEQERHKGIIVGKGGANIKKIGQETRKYAEELLDNKVNLKLFVKVDKDWRDRPDKVAAYKQN